MNDVTHEHKSTTTLAAAVATQVHAHPEQSGICLVADGRDAFALRVHSARAAQRTLDVQTYIWRDDRTGRFISHELLCAADRGVRVRVLLDDMDARARDRALAALDRHARISVRMFNAFHTRSGWLRTLAELSQRGWRLNHRMHCKTWIADGELAITGGRNIGDEYFAAADEVNFIDMDVQLLGPAVRQAADVFERYWESPLSVPIKRMRRIAQRTLKLKHLHADLEKSARAAEASGYADRVRARDGVEQLLQGPFIWSADVSVVADDPRKAMRKSSGRTAKVLDSVAKEIRATCRQVLLTSPYFVPGIGGTQTLRTLAHQGAEVAVLTNSLAATDVAAVHSGYARYREPLLEAGVKIFEMKSAPTLEEEHSRLRLGSSRASLHTKSLVIDGERAFVGSFNIDPRSALLNCEMGVWIRSRTLAQELIEKFHFGADPRRSLALSLDEAGELQWIEHVDGQCVTHRREPHAGWGRRFVARLLQLLPIESQL